MATCMWEHVSVDNMWRHLRYLCEQIGTRFVGSEGNGGPRRLSQTDSGRLD